MARFGCLLVVGGAEDDEGDVRILKRFVEMAGGPEARIGIVAAASSEPARSATRYQGVFRDLGASEVTHLAVDDQGQAARFAAGGGWPRDLTAVFMTGGDQSRLVETIRTGQLEVALAQRNRTGLVVAGTSAGAAAMSALMIAQGRPNSAPTRDSVHLAPGLNLWPDALVDQHFSQRGRMGRLVAALAVTSARLAVGIDEDTAVEVNREAGCFSVLGSGSVSVLDASNARPSVPPEGDHRGSISVSDLRVHVLAEGDVFDYQSLVAARLADQSAS